MLTPFFGLREALEELSGRPVDLITDAALENPHLRRRVEIERRTLFRCHDRDSPTPRSIFGMHGVRPKGSRDLPSAAALMTTSLMKCSGRRTSIRD